MKTHSAIIISDLIEITRQNLNFAELLKQKKENELNWRENINNWTILECLKHLNLYGDFYIPEIEKTILNSKHKCEREFSTGFLGNYFAESLLPKQKLNKMKTFKDKNPLHSALHKEVIDEFIAQQIKIIDLLNKSQNVSLNQNKVNITLTKWIKLKLGDILRIVVNHNTRHIKQIENNIKARTSCR